nr:MAG TPA_asm: hypothetical protein [Bacteriophage sp.]
MSFLTSIDLFIFILAVKTIMPHSPSIYSLP